MKKRDTGFLNIKSWATQDRPREKLLLKGISALSDAELIAILLGTGTTSVNAVDLAKAVLQSVDNNLDDLARLSVNDLMKLKGIGQAKAITIVSALELGRRRKKANGSEKPKIINSQEAYQLIKGELTDLPHEEFWVILLNRANRLIKKQKISLGGVHGTVADPKIIFKLALEELASVIIIVHNHPSGNPAPSQPDIDLTQKLKASGKLLDINLADHLIIAGKEYFSFADEGII